AVAHLWTDLGKVWRTEEQYFKAYPVCRWAQPAMEAAALLRRDHGFAYDEVEAVCVRTFREASCLATTTPQTTDAAQYSLPFPLAALLVRGRVGPDEIDGAALRDPDIVRIAQATTLIDDQRYSV